MNRSTTGIDDDALLRFNALVSRCRGGRVEREPDYEYVEQRVPVTEAEASAFIRAVDAGIFVIESALREELSNAAE